MLTVLSMFSPCTQWVFGPLSPVSLVWSSDGGTICTIDYGYLGTFAVHTYDVSSGTASSPGALQSGDDPHLWMVNESFRVMTMVWEGFDITGIDIFKVGSTLTKIQSFSHRLPNASNGISFSPTTHRISILGFDTLSISNVQNSEVLLHAEGNFVSQCFSSDGSLFAASQGNIASVWKYDSGHYALCGEYQFQGLHDAPLQLSPALSSILGHSKNILQVLRLHQLPTAPEPLRHQYVAISRSGTRVATAHKMESTVTTINILAQIPPQFIDTGVAIEGLILTGNVLLVKGSGQVVAWLFTEEGLADGLIGDRRVGRGDSIWTVRSGFLWEVRVQGQIGVIRKSSGSDFHVYRTDTGEVLYPTRHMIGGYHPTFREVLVNLYSGRNHLRFHNLSQRNIPLGDRWKTSPCRSTTFLGFRLWYMFLYRSYLLDDSCRYSI